MIDRRTMIGGATALGATLVLSDAIAQSADAIQIWPQGTPGGERAKTPESIVQRSERAGDIAYLNVSPPRLIHHPAKGKANGATLLLLPGGGYRRVVVGIEGYDIADAFCAMGYECYSLLYRLPADGWRGGSEAPLQDAQRALRVIRSRVGEARGDRIGVIGFSAGGHLAARLAARQDIATYDPVDAIDRLPLRPRVAGLLYPVILMTGEHIHAGSREQLLGASPTPEQLRTFAADSTIAKDTPPTFITHALDDKAVPPENGMAMLAALRRANVPAEAHFLERGGHGFGLKIGGKTAAWPGLFAAWAATHGLA